MRGGSTHDLAAPSPATPPAVNMSVWTPPSVGAIGKLDGLRLLEADAQRLMKTYGADYGDRGASKHIFLTIDVVGSAGVPHSRWIFASRSAYLVLDPAQVRAHTCPIW